MRSSQLLSAVALVLCVGLVASPMVAGPLGGHTADALGSWWFQWWVAEGFPEATLHHPWGKDVLAHTGANIVDALLALPLRAAFGPEAAWNGLVVTILVTNALATWRLVRPRVKRPEAALVAALVVLLHPYVIYELAAGRPTQALLAPAILALALSDEALASGGLRRILPAGIALAVAGYVYWFGGLFAGLGVAVLALARPRSWARGLAIAGAASLVALPLALPLALRLAAGEVPGVLPVSAWWSGLDLVTAEGDTVPLCTLHLPATLGNLRAEGWQAAAPGLGLVALGLAALSVLSGRRWLVVALVGTLLAIGPHPLGLPNPVYIGLATLVPGMDRLYWPCRALALLVPCTALGAAALAERWRAPAAAAVLVALVSELGIRAQLPLPTWDTEVPEAVRCLAGAEGAVIDLPLGRDHTPLLYQTVHGLPILDGMNPRSRGQVPGELRTAVQTNSYLAALNRSTDDPRNRIAWTLEDQLAVEDLGFRWVLVRLEPLRETMPTTAATLHVRSLASRMEELAGPPIYADDEAWLLAPWGHERSCEATVR